MTRREFDELWQALTYEDTLIRPELAMVKDAAEVSELPADVSEAKAQARFG